MSNIIFEKKFNIGVFQVHSTKPEINFHEIKQTHSNIVINTTEHQAGIEADGILSEQKDALCIQTADCLPVLISGKKGDALIHAGWKGLRNEILLQDKIKEINPTLAFIGPSIQVQQYEVTKEFKDYFPEQFFTTQKDKLLFNLQSFAKFQLQSVFPSIVVDSCDVCTFLNTKFHSFRREKSKGRNWNLFIPNQS